MGQGGFLTQPVVLGRIGAPHGVKGAVHVQSFTEPLDNILQYPVWYVSQAGHWQAYKVSHSKTQTKGFIVTLEGVNDRDAAILLTNAEIAIERSELPELPTGEYYWTDLIGLEVFAESGENLGRVTELFETGANDVLVVRGETKERLIPYLPEVVLAIDLASKRMQVAWDPEF